MQTAPPEDDPAAAAAALLRRRADRLAALAALARPVQHEINNLLTVIFANLDMLKRTAAEGAPQRQLDRVAEAARRFEASSRAILSLARRPVPGDAAAVPPAEAAAALRPLLLVLLPAPGALALEVEPGGWPARFDRARLDEALLGLAAAGAAAVAAARSAGAGTPPGTLLSVAVANRADAGDERVEVALRLPRAAAETPAAAAALAALRALAAEAGGALDEAEADDAGARSLRLLLPRATT